MPGGSGGRGGHHPDPDSPAGLKARLKKAEDDLRAERTAADELRTNLARMTRGESAADYGSRPAAAHDEAARADESLFGRMWGFIERIGKD